MKLTYFGHACFSVEAGGKTLLFDPFVTPNPLAKEIDIGDIKADFILVTHGHGDHVADVEAIAKRTGAPVFAMNEVANWFEAKGVKDTQGMNIGGTVTLGNAGAKMVAAEHSSSMPDGSYAGSPAGFVVASDEGTFYYAGDTALMTDMKLIPESARLDFAVLPIGGHFTMGIEDALRAADYVGTSTIVGVHYDTFPVIKIDKDAAQRAAEKKGKTLLLPKIGETIDV